MFVAPPAASRSAWRATVNSSRLDRPMTSWKEHALGAGWHSHARTLRIRLVCSLSLALSVSLTTSGAVAAPPVTMEKQTLQIKLVPAQSAEDRARNIIANVVVVEEGQEGQHTTLVPYIDDHEVVGEKKTLLTQLEATTSPEAAPRLRYYTPGPSTYKLLCPLCRERSEAAVMRAAGCKDISCCLSLLSW